MVWDWFRSFISDNYNYIPSFTRIWEAARKEIKVKDVKKIKTSRQALMFLKKEQSRLEFELERVPAIKLVEAEPQQKKEKIDRIKKWRKLLTHKKLPRKVFDEFVGKKSEMLVLVDYVDKKGRRIQYIREDNPWSDDEVNRVKSLHRQGFDSKVIAKRFNEITEDNNWLPRSKSSISSKIKKLKKKGEL